MTYFFTYFVIKYKEKIYDNFNHHPTVLLNQNKPKSLLLISSPSLIIDPARIKGSKEGGRPPK